MKTLIYLPFLLLLLSASCKKEEVLPEATQRGKKAFGCYVNGELWVPKGRSSTFQSNFSLTYEPGYKGGSLEIDVYRRFGENPEDKEDMHIYTGQMDSEGIYKLDNPKTGAAIFRGRCIYGREVEIFREGILEITRLDLEEGIISGKFEFVLAKEGCDTIRVTEGRFDYKL